MGVRALAALFAFGLNAGATAQETRPANDLDAFMAKVLARREIDWANLERWVVSDREELALRKGDGTVIERRVGEYVFYVRDGKLVRSPVTIDGVKVSAAEKERYEDRWREEHDEERERRRRRRDRAEDEVDPDAVVDAAAEELADEIEDGSNGSGGDADLDRETFLGFEIEPGNYYLAGRETFEGRDVVVIEYYPENLFSDGQNTGDGGDEQDGDDLEEEIERKLNKTTLVTMLVDPEQHQIVKVTFDNVGMEFLPMKWLVRFDGLEAWMVMDEIEPGIWMPREIAAHGAVSLASGKLQVSYEREFYDYAAIDVGVEVEFGGVEPGDGR